jgi:exonuclease III
MYSIPPIKRHRLTDWIHKQDPAFCCIQETHLSDKGRHYLRIKGWKTIFQANGTKEKLAEVVILISNKINFQPKVIKKDKEEHFILVKDQEGHSILKNLCSKYKGTHIHLKQTNKQTTTKKTLLKFKAQIAPHTIIVLPRSIFINGQIMETQTKYRHSENSRSYEPNGSNRYL